MEGDWVLVYDNILDNQLSTTQKFAKQLFTPYVIKKRKQCNLSSSRVSWNPLAQPIPKKGIKI
jgi:hypothetical protein